MVGKIMAADVKRVLLNDCAPCSLMLSASPDVAEQLEKGNLQSFDLRLVGVCHADTMGTCRTIETIYQNRPINFRLFDDRQAALEWLLS